MKRASEEQVDLRPNHSPTVTPEDVREAAALFGQMPTRDLERLAAPLRQAKATGVAQDPTRTLLALINAELERRRVAA